MGIEPDTKNWTWVLERPCPECGFDAATVLPGGVPDRLRATTAVWSKVLRRDDAQDRPRPWVWSPLEYACHVRDVLRLFDERLRLMLDEDDPLFADWDQDATAVALRYGEQDPARVTEEVAAAGEQLAGRFAGLTRTVWSRTSRRSDGAHFTVASFAAYLLQDLEHHEVDVRPGSPRGAGPLPAAAARTSSTGRSTSSAGASKAMPRAGSATTTSLPTAVLLVTPCSHHCWVPTGSSAPGRPVGSGATTRAATCDAPPSSCLRPQQGPGSGSGSIGTAEGRSPLR